MEKVLMIAEKPKVALKLTTILSNNHFVKRKEKYQRAVYEWNGSFLSKNVLFRMTSICGHIMNIDFEKKNKKLESVMPLTLFDAPIRKIEIKRGRRSVISFLVKAASECKYLVLWLDCDEEGENICFDVIDAVSGVIPNVHSSRVTYRARFSSLTKEDIINAMTHLERPNENISKYVAARKELDLRIGCSFSRQLTLNLRRFEQLKNALITYGPCQTLALGLCVKHQKKIDNFKSEFYWDIVLTAQNEKFFYNSKKIIKEQDAKALLETLNKYKEAEVHKIHSAVAVKNRPRAMDTYELLKACSSELGLSPFQTMDIAEELYLHGYISYPRTKKVEYLEEFDYKQTMKSLPNEFKRPSIINGPREGIKTLTNDLQPIIPLQKINNNVDEMSKKVYELIAQYFLASISSDFEYRITTIELKISNYLFSTKYKTVIKPGFTKFLKIVNLSEFKSCPAFLKMGMTTPIKLQSVQMQTKAPDYLTESNLITLMKTYDIGTPGSIPVLINKIYKRNYARVIIGQKIIPTALGKNLIEGFLKIDPELVLCTLRKEMKDKIKPITEGAEYNDVILTVIEHFKKKFQRFFGESVTLDKIMATEFKTKSETDSSSSLFRGPTTNSLMKEK